MSHAEEIIGAVVNLVRQNRNNLEITLRRKEIREQLGIDSRTWVYSYSPIFQGMREDQPGGAPIVADRFRGIFRRIEHGIYELTDRGKSLVEVYLRPEE